eukprot:GFYU01033232.1.p1 GENE.GFYU01033232.1~~GFYU01033232.1.p1  ORF type:complete len:307 (+),score=55.74 GFYU01033232.1:55-921(+)
MGGTSQSTEYTDTQNVTTPNTSPLYLRVFVHLLKLVAKSERAHIGVVYVVGEGFESLHRQYGYMTTQTGAAPPTHASQPGKSTDLSDYGTDIEWESASEDLCRSDTDGMDLDEGALHFVGGEIEPSACIWTPARVTENLYLSNRIATESWENFESLGITRVVNVTENTPNTFEGRTVTSCNNQPVEYLRCPIADSESQSLTQTMLVCIPFITAAHKAGHRVLVHCHQGVSRSVSVIVAYLLSVHQGLDLHSALSFVRSKRLRANPNKSFMEQLKAQAWAPELLAASGK